MSTGHATPAARAGEGQDAVDADGYRPLPVDKACSTAWAALAGGEADTALRALEDLHADTPLTREAQHLVVACAALDPALRLRALRLARLHHAEVDGACLLWEARVRRRHYHETGVVPVVRASCSRLRRRSWGRSRAAVVAASAAVALGWLAWPQAAAASMIIDRNAMNVRLAVDARGIAVVSYRARGGPQRHVLAWGAANDDVRFRLDYSGGWGTFRRLMWREIKTCGRYDGPQIAWLVAACKAPDGSYWALQAWQRLLPNYGYAPWTWLQRAWELHLSHWRGPLPKLEIYLDWVYGGRYHHLFGRYTYRGRAVHGYRSTSTGVPLDPYGRNIYLDTYDSAYGSGWRRENSFLAHRPNGNFCYGFFPHRGLRGRGTRPPGHGKRYRATAIGPGVAPSVFWTGKGLGQYDPQYEAEMNALSDEVAGGDPLCRQH
jgi:hypothetical protein